MSLAALLEGLIPSADRMLRALTAVPVRGSGDVPGDVAADSLTDAERQRVAALMRVNHAGEICAQALYAGQAAMARKAPLRRELLRAADEEGSHLHWTRVRVEELGGRVSHLLPFWCAGSFALGALAGLAGDRRSLGFLVETERQVEAHLEGHLQQLPAHDQRSRAILERMREDERGHADWALAQGGKVPGPAGRWLMRRTARVMTGLAARI